MLDTYTLEDILNYNDLTPADALVYLVEEEFLILPKIKPLEF